jgi:hypothetical protein
VANPLYGRANGPPSKPDVYTDPKEKAFTFLVPPGWKAEGELLRAGRGGRYLVFSVTGPDGSLVNGLYLIFARPSERGWGC